MINTRRLTLDFVRKEFEKERYILLSNEYKGTQEKLEVLCSKKHSIKLRYSVFQQGKGCIICSGKKKKTIEEVRKEFEKQGYTLLSNKYKNSYTKLKVVCSEKHSIEIRYNNFKQHQRCAICMRKKKKTIEEVKKEFKKRGYTLLSTEYKNAHKKLKILCPNKKHIIKIVYNNFQQGHGCKKCADENIKENNSPLWNGGTSFEPYTIEFTKSLKKEIKKRDDYKCQNPKCFKKSKRLCIHHIDYIKENCNDLNLITVYISCNSRANTDREMWKLKCQNLIKEKYVIITNSF